jgi:hypothetical protein
VKTVENVRVPYKADKLSSQLSASPDMLSSVARNVKYNANRMMDVGAQRSDVTSAGEQKCHERN